MFKKIKKFKKWIIGAIIGGIALAAGLGGITPSQQPSEIILAGIDSTVIPIDEIDTEKGLLEIKNADENSNETFIIKSDRAQYGGKNNYDVFLAITNLRGDEWGAITLKSSSGQKINSAQQYIPIISSAIEPNVESPKDALNTFDNSELKFIAIGSFLISKKS